MSTPDLTTLRDELESERADLTRQLSELNADGAAPDFDENFADSAQVTAEQVENRTLAASLQDQLSDVESALAAVPGVTHVHDLHLWTLTSGMNVATAHLVLAPAADGQDVLSQSRALLRQRHDVQHATLQVETVGDHSCEEMTW